MKNAKYQEQQLIAKICLLGFNKTDTKMQLKRALQKNPYLMKSLESLLECRQHKAYQLSLSQISKIALSAHPIENLNAYKKYYPTLKNYGFEIKNLLDMIDIHEPYILFPILIKAISELKPKGWTQQSIKKLFCQIQNLEKIDLFKEYFFQIQEWQLSKQQIQYLLEEQTPEQLETLFSNIIYLIEEHDYTPSKLLNTVCKYGAAHLNSLKDFITTSIARHYTQNEILAITHHPDGCERLEALQHHYRDLAHMGHSALKIKSIIMDELNAFINQNTNELDTYLQEMHNDRQKWFQQEQYSIFASSEEINERCEMYLEDIIHHF